MSYTYQKAYIPHISLDYQQSEYNYQQVNSPLSYSDNEIDYKEEDLSDCESTLSSSSSTSSNIEKMKNSNHITNKKDLINLIILIIYEDLELKFNLKLNDKEIEEFCNFVKFLITKCSLSLSNLTKNSLILEKILLNYYTNNQLFKIPFKLLKRMILSSFIIGSSSNINLEKWCLITGLPKEILNNDVLTFSNTVSNIYDSISDFEIANLNALLQVQVKKYVRVV